ncbi:hypothetical protein BD324DRAFT_392012 [Kockovaella imperatae]|uniref:holo-[acyl-carrier-protein] synthase n=1 Tax=Kockovaella imperatae TaxID=4999 RepID=A0A1Y1UI19_9TREE|nr:hypothetical protein BD324DRAFT_392012 [Kockovaella imperatae]ORX37688.1 hypothetical protein BD324DRAFT_392012 [Kockovaella imperatae]
MHMYLIELPAVPLHESVQHELVSILPQASQDQLKKYRLPGDALRSLVGQLAPIWYLRTQGLIRPNEKATFGRQGKGKPMLVEPRLQPPLGFNTSHDGSFVLLGVTRGQSSQIGVDLMKIPDNPSDVQDGISEQLTHDERHSLAIPMTIHARSKRISTLWTFKECFVKALGEGIGFGLERIALTLAPDGTVDGVCVDGEDVRWDGWKWAAGFHRVDEPMGGKELPEEYGWTVFWKSDELDGGGDLVHISWDSFLGVFSNPDGDIAS